jgi:signal transduction histidine kinase
VVLVFRDISLRQREANSQRLLAEATAAMAESLDYDTTLARVVDLLVPAVADMCVLYLSEADGTIRRVASTHIDPDMAVQLRILRADPVAPDGPHPAAIVIRSGKTLIDPAITPSVLSTIPSETASAEQLRSLAPMSQALAPLVARQQVIGALAVGAQHEARLSDQSTVAFIEELARRIALALENARLYRDMQQAVRLRDTFLSIASHELKTPLTSLLGQAQLLQRRVGRDGSLSPRDMRAIQVIVDQAGRLSRRIASMLDISQIEQGRLGIVRAPVDLAGLISQVADELRLTLGTHRLIIDLEFAPLVISGDALRLEQVIQNLASNAIKYTLEGGEIVIQLTRRADTAYIAVIDHGMGIPEEALARIFHRYYRASNAASSHVSGVGIGLYLVWEIVTLHGGTIQVQSTEGEGSTFTVALPIDADQEA